MESGQNKDPSKEEKETSDVFRNAGIFASRRLRDFALKWVELRCAKAFVSLVALTNGPPCPRVSARFSSFPFSSRFDRVSSVTGFSRSFSVLLPIAVPPCETIVPRIFPVHPVPDLTPAFPSRQEKQAHPIQSPILHVSVAPLGLELVLRFLPGVPFGHPRLAYKPAQHLTVAPSGG